MQWSYRIARIGETEIKVHGSFILIVAYVLFLSRPRGLRDIVFPLAAVVLIFACVALHELGHSFAARRRGQFRGQT